MTHCKHTYSKGSLNIYFSQNILLRIFLYLAPAELAICQRVCRQWFSVIETFDKLFWECHARAIVPESALADSYLFAELKTSKEKLRAFHYAWNPNDTSRNNYVRTNGFTVHRQPIAQSTDGIRGKIGVSSGIHAWVLTWEGPLGTAAVIGIATRHAALHCPGYVALIGSDDQSWGWNLVDNTFIHNGVIVAQYPRLNNPPKYQIGERVRMILDCEQHQLYFEKGNEFLGLAITQLPPVKLFPAVCAVYGNTEVSMVYIGPPIVG